MGKLITLPMILFAFVCISSLAFAEQSNQERIALLEAQKASMQWEFRYCKERMDVLQLVAEKVDNEISALKAKIEQEKETEEK